MTQLEVYFTDGSHEVFFGSIVTISDNQILINEKEKSIIIERNNMKYCVEK